MSTAFAIAMGAVAISLFTVFLGVRAKKAKNRDTRDKSGGITTATSDAGSTDCGPGDGGGCGGGGD